MRNLAKYYEISLSLAFARLPVRESHTSRAHAHGVCACAPALKSRTESRTGEREGQRVPRKNLALLCNARIGGDFEATARALKRACWSWLAPGVSSDSRKVV